MMIRDYFDRSELRRRLWLFQKDFVWAGIISMFANVLMLTPTLYMLQIYDRVLASGNELTLIVLTVILLLFVAVMGFSERLRSRLLVQLGERISEKLNSRVFSVSFEAFLKNTHKNPTSALSDLTTLRQFLTGNGILVFFDAPWTPVYIFVIFLLHPLLGVLALFFVAIQFGVTFFNHRSALNNMQCSLKNSRESSFYIESKLHQIEAVHSMGMIKNIRDKWFKHHEVALDRNAASFVSQNRQQSVTKFLRYTMQSLTLGAAALLVINGALTPGAMIATSVLMTRSLQPLDILIATWTQIVKARSAFQRLELMLSEYPEKNQVEMYSKPSGAIDLRALFATAEGREEPIIHDLTAAIAAGEVTMVTGPSGSGKSTLARCMLGVWPDVRGDVFLDGHNIASWNRKFLGPYIGYLPQDIELFGGSVAENIARFSDVDSENVIEAAKKTGIHEMILKLPNGYDTQIGEAGRMLSAGQRQRLALARALYGDPSLVVLDEPNANLDEAGDRALIEAVKDLKEQGKTVVLISHRTNVLSVVDKLLVLQEGKMVHFGSRDMILAALQKSSQVLKTVSAV